MSADIAEAKSKLPLPGLLHSLGLGDHAAKSARCPFHDDRRNSFSIWRKNGAWFWKCHTGCGHGDEINFLELHNGISRRDATKLFLEIAGVAQRKSSKSFNWQAHVDALSDTHLERLGNERWYSRAFCSSIHDDKKLVGLHNGNFAFPVGNGSVVGAHVRQDDGSWFFTPKGIKVAPLVIGDLATAKQVHLFESQFDMFAFADRTDLYREKSAAFVCTRGASNGALVKGLLPASVSVCAWPQNDKAGEKWLTDVTAHAGTKVAKAVVPLRFKDLNEWTAASPDNGGASAEDIFAAMFRNKVVETKATEQPKPLIEFRSPLQLKNFTPPPGLVMVGNFHVVKGSVFVIGGAPGVGKSRAAVALAEAGATGHEWFGLTLHRKFKTMIAQTENGEFRLAREFAELDCDALENFVRVCPPPPYGLCFGRNGFREQLAAAIADFAPDVVIYDPWNAAAREQDSREYLDTFDALKSVLPPGDDAPALGIIAHTRKPKTDERASGRPLLNLLAGSYVLGSVPRTVFVMQAASDDPPTIESSGRVVRIMMAILGHGRHGNGAMVYSRQSAILILTHSTRRKKIDVK